MKPRPLVLALILGLFAWFFAAALFRPGLFAFRDAADFYQPLFEFTRSQWLSGRVPLWNPFENLGMPLVGNATASVFYPGTLIFLLPWDYAWAYKIYILAHVLLAAATAYRLARHFGSSVEASGLCALSYAFCGNVLYQYTNVVFLVGAAWMPAAVEAADRMIVARSLRAAVALGVILALMTLGGDPQATYHAGLLAATFALGRWWRERRGSAQVSDPADMSDRGSARVSDPAEIPDLRSRGSARVSDPAEIPDLRSPPASVACGETFGRGGDVVRDHATTCGRWWRERRMGRVGRAQRAPPPKDAASHAHPILSRPALLVAAAVVGFLLAAVAVLPAIEFTAHSERSASRIARSIYEIPACLRYPNAGTRIVGGLTAQVDPGSHEEHVYQFSVGPWRLVEYFWPNFSGRQFPENRRWLDALPWEGRIWVPSFYMGLLPLLLALVRLRLLGGGKAALSSINRLPHLRRWLSWIVVLSIIASFGWYGLGSLESLRVAISGRGSPVVDPPFGGLYWLMTMLLPGYIDFRYPAKLLTLAALGLSLLAALGWDHVLLVQPRRVRRAALILGGVSLTLLVIAMGVRPFWHGWLAPAEPNPLFGPLDTLGAANDLLRSLVHTTILCGLLAWLVTRLARGARWAAPALLVLTALDLAVANGWMVACAPQHLWRDPPQLATAIAAQEKLHVEDGPYRVFRNPDWLPRDWQLHGSPQRLLEAVCWDRATLWPNHNLPAGIALAEVYGTMIPNDYRTLLWAAADAELAKHSAALPSEPGLKLPEGRPVLDLVGAKYLILPAADSLADVVRLPLPGDSAESENAGRPDRGPPHPEPGQRHPERSEGSLSPLEDVSFFYNPRHFPRAWIVHRVTTLPPLGDNDPDTIRRRTDDVLAAGGQPRDFHREAVVEMDTVRSPAPLAQDGRVGRAQRAPPLEHADESCRVTSHEPERVVIDVRLARPGLVVLCDQYYPGWRLNVETAGKPGRETPILRTNRVMRGAWLPAGVHRLTYVYRPATFYYGALLSGLGWLTLAGWFIFKGRW